MQAIALQYWANVLAYIGMAYIVMAYTVVAYTVMVTAYIVMAAFTVSDQRGG